MRHKKSGRQLNRNSSHRKAMFKNMAISLFEHEHIETSLAKAKELRKTAEPLITLAKNDTFLYLLANDFNCLLSALIEIMVSSFTSLIISE